MKKIKKKRRFVKMFPFVSDLDFPESPDDFKEDMRNDWSDSDDDFN